MTSACWLSVTFVGGGSSLSKEPSSQRLMDRNLAQGTSNPRRMLGATMIRARQEVSLQETGLLRQRQSVWNKVAAIRYDSHSRRHC
jgi:hypothetical protein